jgi:hypothetical protein
MRYSLVVLLFLVPSVGAFAQQQKGDVKLQFLGSYMKTTGSSDFKFSMGQVSGEFGKYFTDHLELGIAPTLSVTSTSYTTPEVQYVGGFPVGIVNVTTTNTTTTFGGSAFVNYSFLAGDARTVPYAGAHLYKQDFSKKLLTAGLNVGVKFFITKKTALDVNGNYLFSLTSGDKTGMLLFGVGFSFLL